VITISCAVGKCVVRIRMNESGSGSCQVAGWLAVVLAMLKLSSYVVN
jgi:hypothetical protein